MHSRLDGNRGLDWTPVEFSDDGFRERQTYARKRQKAVTDAKPDARRKVRPRVIANELVPEPLASRLMGTYQPDVAPAALIGTEIDDQKKVAEARTICDLSQFGADLNRRDRLSRDRWYHDTGVQTFLLAFFLLSAIALLVWRSTLWAG